MPPPMQLPAYDYPKNALLNFQPINDAIDSNRAYGLQQEATALKRGHLDLERDQFALKQRMTEEERQHKEVQRIGMRAQVIDGLTGPQRQAGWARMVQSSGLAPHLQKYGIDPNDHENGPRFLIAESGKWDPWKQKVSEAQIDSHRASAESNRAHAEYYRAGARNLDVKAQPATAAQAVDPYAGYGLAEDGTPVPPTQQQSAPAYNFNPSDAVRMNEVRSQMQPPMRLGGPPVDDIDASMRLDEGRPRGGPSGVRVAQMAQGLPPTLMERAQQSQFGRSGMTAPEVPGIVTDAGRTRRTDVPATREMQGQRAYENAGQNEQERFRKMKQEQAFWTSAYGKPARAGYYYGPNGQELAMSEKTYKGDREQRRVAEQHLANIDGHAKTLLDQNWLSRALGGGSPKEGLAGAASNVVGAIFNAGDTAHAFSQLKQSAVGIAYHLSGKQVAVAEMQNFIDAYAPVQGDSERRIQLKVDAIKKFYTTLLSKNREVDVSDIRAAAAMATAPLQNGNATNPVQQRLPQNARPPANSTTSGSAGWSIKRLD